MNWFRDLRVAKKFLLLSMLVVFCFVVALGQSMVTTRKLAASFKQFVDKDQVVFFALSEMYSQGLQTEQATRNVLLDPKAQFRLAS